MIPWKTLYSPLLIIIHHLSKERKYCIQTFYSKILQCVQTSGELPFLSEHSSFSFSSFSLLFSPLLGSSSFSWSFLAGELLLLLASSLPSLDSSPLSSFESALSDPPSSYMKKKKSVNIKISLNISLDFKKFIHA